jgi:hypothetical protein
MNALVEVGGREHLQGLALRGEGPCVSLFLSTRRARREVQQGPIRLRQLLRQAGDRLEADGVNATDIDRLLGRSTSCSTIASSGGPRATALLYSAGQGGGAGSEFPWTSQSRPSWTTGSTSPR